MASSNMEGLKCHTAITFLPDAANKRQLDSFFYPFVSPLSCTFFIKRKARSSSATHFTLSNSEGQGSKVKENFFSHSHACPSFREQQHYRCRVSLKQLNGLLTPRKDLCEKKEKEKKENAPNCSLICANKRPKTFLVIASLCSIFPVIASDRGVGASSQSLPYDSNSSCHLLSYGWGAGVW